MPITTPMSLRSQRYLFHQRNGGVPAGKMFISILHQKEKRCKTAIKTIRVDLELWEKFKKITRLKESDASKELRKFIK